MARAHLLHCVLLLALGTPAARAAQAGKPPLPPTAKRVTVPLHRARVDLENGTVRRGASPARRGLGSYTTSSTFDNMNFSGFVGVDSGKGVAAGPCEWITAGTKGAGATGGQSGLMTGFSFAYCSSALDPRSGGPGGRVRIGFRTGYQTGLANVAGPTGTDVGTFNLSGLPANTGSSSFFGRSSCYLVSIDLGSRPLVLQDGPIGWSWQFRDLGTDGVLAATFPFLSCIQSCSGSGAGGPVINGLDRYCPPRSYLSSFTFGTGAPGTSYYASVSMDLREAQAIPTSTTLLLGSGTNPQVATAAQGPRLGALWSVQVDCSGADPTKLALWRLSLRPPISPLVTDYGEVLIDRAGPGLNRAAPHLGGPAQVGGLRIPLDLNLYGLVWSFQAFCGDTPRGYLTNGLIQTVGF